MHSFIQKVILERMAQEHLDKSELMSSIRVNISKAPEKEKHNYKQDKKVYAMILDMML